ncbi:MAG: hypothetical protein EBR23_06410, partial [Planctomycetia bacterium]|nr:hypothetical protein [Planctomycetia bacterium]
MYDQTSFAKFRLEGRDALKVMQRICANQMDVQARVCASHRPTTRPSQARARASRCRPSTHST